MSPGNMDLPAMADCTNQALPSTLYGSNDDGNARCIGVVSSNFHSPSLLRNDTHQLLYAAFAFANALWKNSNNEHYHRLYIYSLYYSRASWTAGLATLSREPWLKPHFFSCRPCAFLLMLHNLNVNWKDSSYAVAHWWRVQSFSSHHLT